MDDHNDGVDSRVSIEFRNETSQLEAMIDRCRDLIRRTDKLLTTSAKQLETEKSKSTQVSKRLGKERK